MPSQLIFLIGAFPAACGYKFRLSLLFMSVSDVHTLSVRPKNFNYVWKCFRFLFQFQKIYIGLLTTYYFGSVILKFFKYLMVNYSWALKCRPYYYLKLYYEHIRCYMNTGLNKKWNINETLLAKNYPFSNRRNKRTHGSCNVNNFAASLRLHYHSQKSKSIGDRHERITAIETLPVLEICNWDCRRQTGRMPFEAIVVIEPGRRKHYSDHKNRRWKSPQHSRFLGYMKTLGLCCWDLLHTFEIKSQIFSSW